MRLGGQILLALLVLAALQGALAVLTVAAVVLIIWGLLIRTAETAGLLLFLLLLEALGRWPLATVGSLIALAGAVLIASRAKRLPPPPHHELRRASAAGRAPAPGPALS